MTDIEKFEQLKNQAEKLNNLINEYNTQVAIKKEKEQSALKKMKEMYDIDSFEELREYRQKCKQENKENLEALEKLLTEKAEELRLANEKMNQTKENLTE